MIIFLTVVILGYISYEYTSTLLIQEVMDSNLLLIRQVRNDIDKEILNLDRTTFQLSLQAKVRTAMYSSGNSRGNEQMLYSDIIKDLSSIKVSNPAISDIWLHFNSSGVVLNNYTRYSREFFFGEGYPFSDVIDWNEVAKAHPRLVSLGRHRLKYSSDQRGLIIFARSIPVDDESSQGIACVDVDESVFGKALNDLGEKAPSLTLVLDSSGKVVLRSRPRQAPDQGIAEMVDDGSLTVAFDSREGYLRNRIGKGEYLLSFTTSDINGWRYVSLIPTGIIMEKSNKIRQMTVVAALFCLALGILISYLLTKRLYRPILEIVSYIRAFQQKRKEGSGDIGENEFALINRIISYVYKENEDLKDVFSKNIPILREKFLYDVLDGKMAEKEFVETSARLSMEFPFSRFSVVVFEKEDDASWGIAPESGTSIERRIDEMALEKYGETLRTHSLRKGSSRLVTVVNSPGNASSSEILNEFLKDAQAFFLEGCGLVPSVGVGNVYDDWSEIASSLKDALSAARFKVVKGFGKITYFDEVKEVPEHGLAYSVMTERKIINSVKAGDEASSLGLIEEVIRSSIIPGETSPEIVENLFYALAATAMRTIYEIRASVREVLGGSGNIYRELLDRQEIEKKREYVAAVFSSISRYIRGRNLGKNQKIKERIESFVKANFADELSLSRLGEATGFSPAYLSSIFKDLFQESFVDYVSRIRVEEARSLLGRPELSVGQVAAMAGFTSANTFIKVFKKHEGITPGQYRGIDGV
jgi:two-component system, response regulator YesN